jgi:hypothetical protein
MSEQFWSRVMLITLFSLLMIINPSVKASTKKALVIGNSDYVSRPLANPVNDARDMSVMLKALGFDVLTLTNANLEQMNDAIDRFGEEVQGANTVLIYYAGHGVQVKGQNYLIPVKHDIRKEHQVASRAVSLSNIMGYLEEANTTVNIVLLDACRDNPFSSAFRSMSRGLARVEGPTGTYISFATAEGKVAADGVGQNGLFTSKLLKHIPTPGLTIEQVMKKVRAEVMQATNNEQVPWENSSLTSDFYFIENIGQSLDDFTPIKIVADTFETVIRSNVYEDKVYIDDKLYGSTPVTLGLNEGNYKIRIEKYGYTTFNSTFYVGANQDNRIFVKLQKEQSLLDDIEASLPETLGSVEQSVNSGVDTVGNWFATLFKWLMIIVGSVIALIIYLIVSGRMKKIVDWINE